MEWVVSIAVLGLVLGAIALLGKLAWKYRTNTNTSKFFWLSGTWIVICWFLTGMLVFIWPVFVVLSTGFAAYALYALRGTDWQRAVLSFSAVLPGTVSYALLTPSWPHGWASFKPIFIGGPPAIVFTMVAIWFGVRFFYFAKARG
jgi:hypothetical protein